MTKSSPINIFSFILILWISLPYQSVYSQEAKSNKTEFILINLPDTLPPRVTVFTPELNDEMRYRSYNDVVTLTGEVTDESPVKFVAINSKKIVPGDTGAFSSRIELYPGENEIRIVASDLYYNLSEQFIYIEYTPYSVSAVEKPQSP